ncbi:hypothetical protein BC629DRAFT_1452059 [Irpex lacteus]|nr:hypothetical protein BC629DRAFT_1452059 [Irpex lacteus]
MLLPNANFRRLLNVLLTNLILSCALPHQWFSSAEAYTRICSCYPALSRTQNLGKPGYLKSIAFPRYDDSLSEPNVDC